MSTGKKLGIACSQCKKILQKLEDMVGKDPDKVRLESLWQGGGGPRHPAQQPQRGPLTGGGLTLVSQCFSAGDLRAPSRVCGWTSGTPGKQEHSGSVEGRGRMYVVSVQFSGRSFERLVPGVRVSTGEF